MLLAGTHGWPARLLKRCSIIRRCSDLTQGNRCPAADEVRAWADRVVLGLGLCPWAARAAQKGTLRYMTCSEENPLAVASFIRSEAVRLQGRRLPPLSTSLVVCPRVPEWKDFKTFDSWVTNGQVEDLEDMVSLVVFHPAFERWHALSPELVPGSHVRAYFEEADGQRSSGALPAVVQSLDPGVVGARRVGLKFLDDGAEQWVPQEWLSPPAVSQEPLPDNWMHRAPHPTVHLIRRRDLEAVRNAEGGYDAVAAVQAKNSRCLRHLSQDELHRLATQAE
ncbi:unnamed protein product [Polarella glacialis]|uniref:Uncharacterized protein n=2 Tax=Polarella glacialis TaxID=89957 RepID=A0A813K160_POLGL|nr:unnamed protein product [Polarella glacialis]